MKKLILVIMLVGIIPVTSLSARDWESIKKSGTLNVGVRDGSNFVYHSIDKEEKGMMHDMAQSFAKYYGLKMKIKTVPSFAQYWKLNGEILLKNNITKTPEIYNDIDIASEIFTVTKRREELINMSPYLDNVEIFFGKHDQNVKSYKDLIGKRVLTYASMSFKKVILSEMENRNIPYIITYVNHKDDKLILPKGHKVNKDVVNVYLFPVDTKSDSSLIYHYMAKGEADVSLNDTISVMITLFDNNYYSSKLRPYFPAQKNMTKLAWGSSKRNKVLNEKIKEFIQHDKFSGNFSKRLYKYTGMTLDEYNKLINMME